jgi:hypothetical protein
MYEEYTHVVLGNIFNDITLESADAKHASAAFIFSNQYDREDFKSDMFCILASNVIYHSSIINKSFRPYHNATNQ